MAHVVTERCVDCRYTDCCAVCPVDCFYETEAEAVAFVVSQDVGQNTNTASSDYIQLCAGSKATLAASLDRIQHAATAIISAIHRTN